MRALVTGSSRGIGREIARQLIADHGFEVIVTARSADDARAAAAELGPSACGEALDVFEDASVRALRGRVVPRPPGDRVVKGTVPLRARKGTVPF